MKILVASDGKTLRASLEKESFEVDVSTTLDEAKEKIALLDYDCIILDFDLLRSKTFLIIDEVTSLNKSEGLIVLFKELPTEDKVKLLDHGADDIISIPIELPELTARIRAIIRRKKFQSRIKIYFGNMVIDIFSKTVSVWSTLVSLTKTEFEILLYLISNKNKVVSKISLAEYIWGESADNLDTFDSLFTHIKNLRRKLKEVKAEVEFRSIYGVGYQIIEL